MTLRTAFRRFFPHLRPDLRYYLLAACALLVGAAGEIASVYILSDVVDSVLDAGSVGAVLVQAVLWIGVTAATSAAAYLGSVWAVSASERFVLRLRDRLHAHSVAMGAPAVHRIGLGDLVIRHSQDVEAVEHLAGSGVLQLAVAAVQVCGLVVVALVMSWQVALVALIAVPLLLGASSLFVRAQLSAADAERDAAGAIGSAVHDGLAALTTTVAHNREAAESRAVHRHGSAWLRTRVRQARIESAMGATVSVGQVLAMFAVAGAGAWQVRSGDLAVGRLVALTGYLGYLYPKVQEIADLRLTVSSAVIGADRVADVLDTPTAAPDRPGAQALTTSVGLLEVRDVTVGHDRAVLRDCTFTLRPGTVTALVGPSGSGKSSLSSLLSRSATPWSGRVMIDGRDIATATGTSVREQVTLLPQDTVVRHGTVAENIDFGSGCTEAEVVAAARAAGIDDVIRGLPDGYRTELQDGGLTLSGGQRRRIALARALARPTPILLLDEPTTGVDAATVDALAESIRPAMTGRTVLIITHDLRFAHALTDDMLEIAGGTVVQKSPSSGLARVIVSPGVGPVMRSRRQVPSTSAVTD